MRLKNSQSSDGDRCAKRGEWRSGSSGDVAPAVAMPATDSCDSLQAGQHCLFLSTLQNHKNFQRLTMFLIVK